MNEDFFQIDKKDTVSKFKDFVRNHSERADSYNPSNAKHVDNHRNYFILDRIRALYHWIINEAKLNLRRKYIHDDKEYKKVLGKLESYARNKIKSEKDGTISKDQHRDYSEIIQKLTDDFIGQIDHTLKGKDDEILQI